MRIPGFPVLAVALLLGTGPGGAGGARAQDAPPDPAADPAAAYGARRASAYAPVARRLLSLADWCRGQDLKATAIGLYARVLEFAPDDPVARAQLGFRRDGGAWRASGLAPNPPTDSSEPARVATLATKRKATGRDCAKDLLDLARWCGEMKLEGERRTALFQAVDLDPENAAAREGLGFKRQGSAWVHQEYLDHVGWVQGLRAWAKADVSTPVYRKPVESASEWEAVVGKPVTAFRSRHFTVHSTQGKEGTDHLIVVAEQGWQFLEHVLGVKVGREEENVLVLMGDRASYERVLDRMYAADPARLKVARRMIFTSPDWNTTAGWRPDPKTTEDFLVHHAVETALHEEFPWANQRPWIREGLTYLATGTMRGTAWTWCIAVDETGTKKEDYDDIAKWGRSLKALVAARRDEDLAAVAGVGFNDFSSETVAKAWSVIGWLAEKRPKDLVEFLRSFDSTGNAEAPAAKAFATGLAALDREWREWVRLAY